jgi:beta-glucosidase
MNRRQLIKYISILGSAAMLPNSVFSSITRRERKFSKSDFGKNFRWGVATAAFQNEGAWDLDGKGESIWDHFNHQRGNIKDGSNADVTCDFYHRYRDDLSLAKRLGFDYFRMSIGWSRIFPSGTGEKNQKGVDYYHRVFDACHELNIEPFVTLYHWDLPQALEDKGGWVNRDVISWFGEYVDSVSREYGSKINNWCVLNEPTGFIGLGYVQGMHAPGDKRIKHLFPGILHAGLCQAEGGRIIRANKPGAYIGTSFSCSHVDPESKKENDVKAALRMDAFLNRLFIEPLVGMGYPVATIPALKRIEKHMKADDDEKLKFDFDYIGIQNYFRLVGKHAVLMPAIHANEIPASKRNVPVSEMKWEVYPEGLYHILKKFSIYPIKEFLVTENGCCYADIVENGKVHDHSRIKFFEDYLEQLLRAKREGVNVNGYFVWTLNDNFEWAEGYVPRFGLVYTDFKTQQRIIKDSGYWFQKFLAEE